jgi:hypothetical protein
MVRLIVEDAGERRAFSVGEGRLTMGSAPEAKLQLSAMGVAGVHAEIEVHGGKATMHPKPGVTPPRPSSPSSDCSTRRWRSPTVASTLRCSR